MTVKHFLAVVSVLMFQSCPSQYYHCDVGKVHIVNDFCACCFTHILQRVLSRPFFELRLYMCTPSEGWAFTSELNVNCRSPGSFL